MSDMAIEHEFPLDEDTWVVRAYGFPTAEEAKAGWERVHAEWKGNEGDFSIWRTRLSDGSADCVVLCGRRETLVEVGGEPFAMPYEAAKQFALRRARVLLDGLESGEKHVEQEMRYGEDSPVRIDPDTGGVVPYRP